MFVLQVEVGGSGPIFLEDVVFLVSVIWTVMLGFEEPFCLFGVSVATVALVDSFEGMDVFNKLFDVIFELLWEWNLLIVVKHKKWVFEP